MLYYLQQTNMTLEVRKQLIHGVDLNLKPINWKITHLLATYNFPDSRFRFHESHGDERVCKTWGSSQAGAEGLGQGSHGQAWKYFSGSPELASQPAQEWIEDDKDDIIAGAPSKQNTNPGCFGWQDWKGDKTLKASNVFPLSPLTVFIFKQTYFYFFLPLRLWFFLVKKCLINIRGGAKHKRIVHSVLFL